jgi:mono/diheme cytochrome c family protein
MLLALTSLLLACDYGGRGGGPTGGPRVERELPELPTPPVDPVERGRRLYLETGCILCHGEEGKGEVENENCETGGIINGLTLVKEGYDEVELHEHIRKGVRQVGKEDENGITPPLRMPSFGAWLSPQEIDDLVAYLFSMYPEDREMDDWDDWDEE